MEAQGLYGRMSLLLNIRYRRMTCDFTSFSTVLQSYQDDGQLIMKGCEQWNPVYA